jgi:hypothetical protein
MKQQQTITGFEVAISDLPLCQCCYQPFERTRPNKIYCSKECRKAAWYEANRDQVIREQREKRAAQRDQRLRDLDLTQRTPRRRRNSSETIDDLLSIIQMQQQQIAQLTQLVQGQATVPPAILKPVATTAKPDNQEIEIGITKAQGGGNSHENFMRCLSGMAGVSFAVEKPEPTNTGGIKKLDVPQFEPPSFDDDFEL